MSFKKSISNKSLFLFCWLFFCVFMNSGPGHGNCKKNVNIDWQDWKSLRPYPHFKHLENNGVWCDWINEIAQTVKRAHILYINLIIFTWQKWKKKGEKKQGVEVWLSVLPPKEPSKWILWHREWCADWGWPLSPWPSLLSIHQPWSLTSLFRKLGPKQHPFHYPAPLSLIPLPSQEPLFNLN